MFKKFVAEETPLTSEIRSALHIEEARIAEGVSIQGTLRFAGVLRIDGHFEGTLESSGTLIIGPTGSVIADLNLHEAFISGSLKGNITVHKQLSLRGRAEITGDIRAPLISIDEGVSLQGHLHITTATQDEDEDLDAYSPDH